MNVFLFQNRFEADIVAGRKPHTIRGHRRDGKPRAKVGETISLRVWTGLPYRSKQREFARAVVEDVTCVTVEWNGMSFGGHFYWQECWRSKLDEVARKDGFADWPEMVLWFNDNNTVPFCGVLVKWRLV